MKDEVSCATDFIAGFVQKADDVSYSAAERFKQCFADRMTKKYSQHWHPQKPQRGSAYRSIVIDHDSIDPLIFAALKDVNLDSGRMVKNVQKKLPRELTLWVDPNEVSYRFGDHGSVGILYSQSPAKEATSDYESGVSSTSSSPCSTPPQSPYEYRQQQSAHSIYHPCGREAFFSSPFPNRCYYNGMETTVA